MQKVLNKTHFTAITFVKSTSKYVTSHKKIIIRPSEIRIRRK